jgi:hypothetical protein
MALIPHRRKLLLFALLSLADLDLTMWLLGLPGGVYESNPLAAWCLGCQGWAGLVLLKTATVLVAGVLLVLYCRFRPRAGQRALTLVCAVVAAVVVYSGCLAASLDWKANQEGTTLLVGGLRRRPAAAIRPMSRLNPGKVVDSPVAGRLVPKDASFPPRAR